MKYEATSKEKVTFIIQRWLHNKAKRVNFSDMNSLELGNSEYSLGMFTVTISNVGKK